MVDLPSTQKTREAIYDHYYKNQGDGRRDHLGASLIGHECSRYIWLSWRWAKTVKHDGRLLRLFETGNLAEERISNNIRATGATVLDVDPNTGRQWNLRDDTGHFGGSMDAAIVGLLEAPKTWHVGEYKTHSETSFTDLAGKKDTKTYRRVGGKGVMESKPQHYTQMQTYMGMSGMTRAFYFAVNKNTDEIHTERVEFDLEFYMRIVAKKDRIIKAQNPPDRQWDATFYKCKHLCDKYGICHGGEFCDRNCRTCMFSTPVENGNWVCEHPDNDEPQTIGRTRQRIGCAKHRFIPSLVPFEQTDFKDGKVIYAGWTDEGQDVE